MRIEIRCRLIYYLDLALREGNYAPDEEQTDPDPYINILNTDLTEMEELICESLPPRKANFVFDNITKLIDKILLNGVRMLKQVNKNGVLKLVSNVESLQQNLIGFVLVQDNQLSKTKKYFKLMTMSGSEILNFMSINKGLFGFDDYKMVMELRLEEPERSNTIQFMKDYFIQNKA